MVNDSIDADMVIFLDKTARPLAHFYRKLFPVIHPDKPISKIKFLNIGSEKMGDLYSYAWEDDHEKQDDSQDRRWKLPEIDPVISAIHTQNDLNDLFGKENVDQLVKVLEVVGVDLSFVTQRASNHAGRDYSLRVRKELDMLADEIKGEIA